MFPHKNVLRHLPLLLSGFYMYIETSRPRLEGEKARLLSPVFSIAPKNPYGPTNTAYCFSFFYHMYGQHIGKITERSIFCLLILIKFFTHCMKTVLVRQCCNLVLYDLPTNC